MRIAGSLSHCYCQLSLAEPKFVLAPISVEGMDYA